MEEDQVTPRPGHCFDRVLFTGSVFEYAYLVGQGRHFQDGVAFTLSDHFGVMALLDIRSVYLGASGVGVLRMRRGALDRMRNGEAFAEVY